MKPPEQILTVDDLPWDPRRPEDLDFYDLFLLQRKAPKEERIERVEPMAKQVIQQVYSRVRTPTDNPALERFNWTVQDEWPSLSEVGLDDISEANLDLIDWLIEYNNHRPHEALDYQTPLAYASEHQVLPMTPSSTTSF